MVRLVKSPYTQPGLKRNHLIDLLRFIAAVSVMLYHQYVWLAFKPDNLYTNFFATYGRLGVPVFFVISGYCIMIALNHSRKPAGFIIRRFFRIFPPFWFSMALTLLVVLIGKLIYGTNSMVVLPKSPVEIFRAVTLLTSPITAQKPINSVCWTLSLEAGFYIIIFFCGLVKKSLFTPLLVIITAITCIIPLPDQGAGVILRFWPLFASGVAVFKLLHDGKNNRAINFLLLGLALYAFYPTGQEALFFISTLISIMLIVLSHYRPVKPNALSKLGDLSYAIYLIHIPLTVLLLNKFRDQPPLKGNGLLNFMADIVLVLLVTGFSKPVHRYIELPAINLGKKLSAGKAAGATKKS